ncbi:ABC transporter permease [Streptomyces chartreusis]|uniref:ABC transporter permease n=1 Tax=Streptomyces chartreusis TaxID=1969 RepID=UPI0033C3B498
MEEELMQSPSTTSKSMLTILVVVPLTLAFALWAFAWPSARTEPRDLPVGLAGPPQATEPVAKQLQAQEGAFDIHEYEDLAQARSAVEEREVYGALVVTPERTELLTASAASPAVAQLLKETLVAQAPAGNEPVVTDVVPLPEADPRGAALATSPLPLAIGGVIAGASIVAMGLRRSRAVATLVAASLLAGVSGALIAHSWLDVLTGDWAAEAAVLSGTVLAAGAMVAGLSALMGRSGVVLGQLMVVLLGNAWAAVSTSRYLLPEPVGLLGQWLPPGAGVDLLRSVSYFDSNVNGHPLAALVVWVVVGLTMMAVGGRRKDRRSQEPAMLPDAAASA